LSACEEKKKLFSKHFCSVLLELMFMFGDDRKNKGELRGGKKRFKKSNYPQHTEEESKHNNEKKALRRYICIPLRAILDVRKRIKYIIVSTSILLLFCMNM
jgi:hypothetical protein